jgi:hypothetical protein
MYLHPSTEQEVMALAAHSALMAEMLDGLVNAGADEDQRLVDGIKIAFRSIAAFLGRRLGASALDGLPRENLNFMRGLLRDDNDLRAEAEGR